MFIPIPSLNFNQLKTLFQSLSIFGIIFSNIDVNKLMLQKLKIMKKLFVMVALSSVMFACNNKSKQADEAIKKEAQVKAIKDSMRLDSFAKADMAIKEQVKKDAEVAAAYKAGKHSSSHSVSTSSSGGTSSSSYGGTQPTAKKQGWSEAAKGAVIGGAAGAVGGAIIDKKKGRGAVVGGVVGAGTGYLIGRGKDKKSGRVQKQ